MTHPVLLVGAGPGDPDLLTVRAVRALAHAEVVYYDALVDPRVLALATKALCLPVGKRAGSVSTEQSAIEAALVRSARSGRRVVRLKAGDPFVFGRGGEEALALHAAGLDWEMVPGISSALAGPAAAGIPVTHRGVAGGFAVLTAQPADAWHATVAALPPGALTLVFLMSLGARREIVYRLLARGWSPAQPAAIVVGAHTAAQWSWTGPLSELAEVVLPPGPPGLLVIGDVVTIAERITECTAAASTSEDHLATA
ncbi:MAG: uroporphyrinogen-III C-methyltransferase [Polyangia bacterium]